MQSEPPRTVFFLSDFGTQDEFAGVVHAVIARRAPGTTVIDLTHHVPPFDVRAGSHTLVRAVPHLGPGLVLGVVDPGVGTARRGICMAVPLPAGGTLYFVGPDNGLLVAAAEAAGEAPVTRVVELRREQPAGDQGTTFDGRDLFAPVVAALCTGTAPEELGEAVDPGSLVRLVGGVVEQGRLHDGRTCLRAEVTWVDHFGNLQLAATVADARIAGIPLVGSIELAARIESGRQYLDGLPHSLVPDGVALRCVDAFGDLKQGEFGLLVDANGHLAVVAGEASAASWLNVAAGELLILAW
jgi:S-adenosyl-L-methionine hydrolase (adenosine-forming)